MKEMSTDEYDKGWDTKWDQMKVYGPYARHLRRIIFTMIQSLQFETVLDVGCGQGSLLADLHTIFPRISLCGTDFSPASITKARQRLPYGEFLVMDLTRTALTQKFDLVVCTDVLEHIEDDITALSNLARMTSTYVLIATIQGRMRSHERESWGHVRNYASGELAQKMQHVGLRSVRTIEWGFPFFSPLYRDVNYLLGGRGTGGQYGVLRKTLAQLIYQVFRLNSHSLGDEIFILAEPVSR